MSSRRLTIFITMLLTTVVKAGDPFQGKPAVSRDFASAAQPVGPWRLFAFRDGEHFRYEFIARRQGEAGKGFATIDVALDSAHQTQLSIAGSAEGKEVVPTAVAFSLERASDFVRGAWANSDLTTFLAHTVFAAHWVVLFAGRELKAGARWRSQNRDLAFEVEVLGPCTVAGVSGLQGRWSARSPGQPEALAEWCIAPQVPLLLKADLRVPAERSSAEITLVEYRAAPEGLSSLAVAGAAPAARPAVSQPTAGSLDGLYIGRYAGGDQAVSYFFTPSGRVTVDAPHLVDPDAVVGWKKVLVPIGGDLPEGDQIFDLRLGTYAVRGNQIELRTREVKADAARQLMLLQELWRENWERDQVQAKPLRVLAGGERLEIDGAVLIRQADQTGGKLAGEFANEVITATLRRSGRATFTPDGRFSLSEEWTGGALINVPSGSANQGNGRYEIQGNEIILRYSDGRVEKRLFGYLGQAGGKEYVAMGGLIWIKGAFGGR